MVVVLKISCETLFINASPEVPDVFFIPSLQWSSGWRQYVCQYLNLYCLVLPFHVSCPRFAVFLSRLYITAHFKVIKPLNAELNPICHLLALLEAHHILHVSRIRVKFLSNVSLFFCYVLHLHSGTASCVLCSSLIHGECHDYLRRISGE